MKLQARLFDPGVSQGVAVVVHDQAVTETDVVQGADLDEGVVIRFAVAHVVEFAQKRVEGLRGVAELPAAVAEIALTVNEQLHIEGKSPIADGNIGPEGEPVPLLVRYRNAAHAAGVLS